MVPGSTALSDSGVEQFLAGGGVGQRNAQAARAVQRQIQILLVQRDAEARRKIAADHPLAMHFQNARIGKATHQRLPHPCRVGTCLGGEQQRLAHRLDGE